MEVRTAASPKDVKHYTTERLREEFLIPSVFCKDEVKLVYSHNDRIIVGGIMPVERKLMLTAAQEIRTEYFLQRRELGVINIGGPGYVKVDGKIWEIDSRDGIYIGMGNRELCFESKDRKNPAKFYLNSAPAHQSYPTKRIKQNGNPDEDTVVISQENKVELGKLESSNHRTICKYILPGQVKSCQLEMGMTSLKPGSVWNTLPCHTHDRRMEVYLYFDIPEDGFVMHYMGEPTETRHIIVHNEEAVISPSWSSHSGCGSQAYTFIWGMVGENQDFDDMDGIDNKDLR